MDQLGDDISNSHKEKMKKFKNVSGAITPVYKHSAFMAYNGQEIRKILTQSNVDNSVWVIMDEVKIIPDKKKREEFLDKLILVVKMKDFLDKRGEFCREERNEFDTFVKKNADKFHTEFDVKKVRPKRGNIIHNISSGDQVKRERTIPKAHMLVHCAEFVKRWRYLAPFGECSIESHHKDVHSEFERHGNRGKNMVLKSFYMAQNIYIMRSAEVKEGERSIPPVTRYKKCQECGKYFTKNNKDEEYCKCIMPSSISGEKHRKRKRESKITVDNANEIDNENKIIDDEMIIE